MAPGGICSQTGFLSDSVSRPQAMLGVSACTWYPWCLPSFHLPPVPQLLLAASVCWDYHYPSEFGSSMLAQGRLCFSVALVLLWGACLYTGCLVSVCTCPDLWGHVLPSFLYPSFHCALRHREALWWIFSDCWYLSSSDVIRSPDPALSLHI